MNKIIVTGANGFIGKNVVSYLEDRNSQVVKLSRDNGDITDPKLLSDFSNVSHVIHLAGKHFVPDSWEDPYEFMRVNFLGTQNIIDFCLKNRSRLIFASTYLYGVPEYNPIPESHPIFSNNPYALSKYFAEQSISFFCKHKDLDAKVLRLFNVYGHGQRNEYLIPSILNNIETGKDIQVNSLIPRRDYVYIEDVVKSIILSLECRGKYDIFNIGSGVSHSVQDLIGLIKNISKSNAKVVSKNIQRKNEVMNVIADIGYAKEKLGWIPDFTLEDGLRDIWLMRNSL